MEHIDISTDSGLTAHTILDIYHHCLAVCKRSGKPLFSIQFCQDDSQFLADQQCIQRDSLCIDMVFFGQGTPYGVTLRYNIERMIKDGIAEKLIQDDLNAFFAAIERSASKERKAQQDSLCIPKSAVLAAKTL